VSKKSCGVNEMKKFKKESPVSKRKKGGKNEKKFHSLRPKFVWDYKEYWI
jgi:hypothetical protein